MSNAMSHAESAQGPIGLSNQDAEILARLPLLAGLSADSVQDLLRDAAVQTYDRGTLLFVQDDPATRFFVILDGWVKLFRNSESGDESVIAVFTRGESFAEAAIFGDSRYPVSATVVEDSRLLVVPAMHFLRRLSENGDYALKMMASMSRHLRQLVTQVEQLTLNSSAERLAAFLLKLSPRDDGAVVIRLPFDKSLIAGRLGMQPETFSRSLNKLRGLGVECKGPLVSVADVAALRGAGAAGGLKTRRL
ncbi:MAG: Crp/Fnr family transcriptional regulator [Pseudomonadota bacterium]